ncbi:putative RING-H2 finger protein ATL73-like [Capsicum annuum]|nr:putative RING-H2 finger protein ATL73-like [Capsicum annuum]
MDTQEQKPATTLKRKSHTEKKRDEEEMHKVKIVERPSLPPMNSTRRTQRPKMLTQVEKNRRARRKEQLKAEAEAIKATQLFKEIDSLPDIIQEIEREEGEKQKRHLRCVTAKKEKLKSCPPRLGKRKFEPAPAQVLLSEEITGSLRKLKGCCTLARDRFKSLEKRGLVVPSKKSSRK